MAPSPLLIAGQVLRGRGFVTGAVEVVEGRVALPGAVGRGGRVPLPEGWCVVPGFVDLQVNGFAGVQVGVSPDEHAAVSATLPRHGVTAFCPTVTSRGATAYARAARALERTAWPRLGARSLGVHLEGPLLNTARRGAHPPGAIRAASAPIVADLAARFAPRIVTLAPERDGALALIRRLRAAGAVVAIGHTGADADLVAAAVTAGARMLTHAFNAMPGVRARAAGPVGAAALDPRVHVGIIADGVHVEPRVLALASHLAGRRLVAVSDASAAAGAPDGVYRLGAREVVRSGDRVTDAGGRLAGSALGLDAAPGVLCHAGRTRAASLHAVTFAPRRLLGLGDPWAPGVPADLVVLDGLLRPRATLVAGAVAWSDWEALPAG